MGSSEESNTKGAGPSARQIGQEEVQAPEAAQKQANDGRIMGHVGLFVYLAEYMRSGTPAADGYGVQTAHAAEHKAVHGAYAGYCDEQVKYIAQHVAEYVYEGHGSAGVYELLVSSAAGYANIVEDVGGNDDDRAYDQSAGQVFLGIL